MYNINFLRTLIFSLMVSFMSMPVFAQSGKFAKPDTKINPFKQSAKSFSNNGFNFHKTIQSKKQAVINENQSPREKKARLKRLGLLPARTPNPRFEGISRDVPSNDECEDAIEIRCGDNITGHTDEASTSDFVDQFLEEEETMGVWYKLYGTGETVTMTSNSETTDYDNRITVFEGRCGDLRYIGTNDDAYDGDLSSHLSEATWNTERGRAYYIFVSGYDYESYGYFDIDVSCRNRCDITEVEVYESECNDDGTYYLELTVYGQYFPLNGDIKVVVGGQTIEIATTNDMGEDGVNIFDLEYFDDGMLDIELYNLDIYNSNGEIYIQADRGCGYVLRGFEAPDCEGAEPCDLISILDYEITCYDDFDEEMQEEYGENTYQFCVWVEADIIRDEPGGEFKVIVNGRETEINRGRFTDEGFAICFIKEMEGHRGNDLTIQWQEGVYHYGKRPMGRSRL